MSRQDNEAKLEAQKQMYMMLQQYVREAQSLEASMSREIRVLAEAWQDKAYDSVRDSYAQFQKDLGKYRANTEEWLPRWKLCIDAHEAAVRAENALPR